MKDPGWLLHLVVGGMIMLLALLGVGREVLQHDWSLSLHQWIEGLSWPAGGIFVAFVGWPLLKRLRPRGGGS